METKSRYEVVADLESKKRDLINERDNLDEDARKKEKEFRELERMQEDNATVMARKVNDAKEDADKFKERMEERKITINELIKSVEDSLERFNKLTASKT